MRRRLKFTLRRVFPSGLRKIIFIAVFVGAVVFLIRAGTYMRQLTAEIALSDACDLVTIVANETVKEKMAEGGYDYSYFVSVEKNEDGDICAISGNIAHINSFSAEVLHDVVNNSERQNLDISIPIGNLIGLNLTLGKGPDVTVNIIMLSSSRTSYRSEMISAGINQTLHRIILEMTVDIDILVPWGTLSDTVNTETLIAETVIVGDVPETYFNMEN